MSTKTVKENPRNFIYPDETKVEIDGHFLSTLMQVFDKLVDEEIKVESKFKYKYVKEDGSQVKSPKKEDIETGKVRKVLDTVRTLQEPTLDYSITEKGLGYAELKNFLESYHYDNIQKGIAVDYRIIQEKQD